VRLKSDPLSEKFPNQSGVACVIGGSAWSRIGFIGGDIFINYLIARIILGLSWGAWSHYWRDVDLPCPAASIAMLEMRATGSGSKVI